MICLEIRGPDQCDALIESQGHGVLHVAARERVLHVGALEMTLVDVKVAKGQFDMIRLLLGPAVPLIGTPKRSTD